MFSEPMLMNLRAKLVIFSQKNFFFFLNLCFFSEFIITLQYESMDMPLFDGFYVGWLRD